MVVTTTVLLRIGSILAETGDPSESRVKKGNPLIPATYELIWGSVAFLIFAAFMMKFVFPRAKAVAAERREGIEGKLEAAEKDRQEARALLEEHQRQVDGARDEAAGIVAAARRQAEQVSATERKRAQDEAARIVEGARSAMASERRQTIEELRRDLGGISVSLAERILGQALSDDDRQRRLVEDFIADLEGDGPGGARDAHAPTSAPDAGTGNGAPAATDSSSTVGASRAPAPGRGA